MTAPAFVQWYLEPDGYAVTVYDSESQPIYEYRAGNSPRCSATRLPLDHPRRVRKATLRRFSIQTAAKIANEYGLPESKVSHDNDSEADAFNPI